MKQLNLIEEVKTSNKPEVRNCPVGECFKLNNTKSAVYIKVSPVTSLLNSHLIREVIERGDAFAVNLNSGTLTVLPGNKYCIPIDAAFKIIKEEE